MNKFSNNCIKSCNYGKCLTSRFSFLFAVSGFIDSNVAMEVSDNGTGGHLGYEFPVFVIIFFLASSIILYFILNGEALVKLARIVESFSLKISSFFIPEKRPEENKNLVLHKEIVSAVGVKKVLREFLDGKHLEDLEKEKESFEIFPDPNADYYDDKKNIKREDLGHKTPFNYLVDMDIKKGETLKSVKYDKYNPDRESDFVVDLDEGVVGETVKLDFSESLNKEEEAKKEKLVQSVDFLEAKEDKNSIKEEKKIEIKQVKTEDRISSVETKKNRIEAVKNSDIPQLPKTVIENRYTETAIEHSIGILPKKIQKKEVITPLDFAKDIFGELKNFSLSAGVKFDDSAVKLVILAGEMKREVSLKIMQHIINVSENWGHNKNEIFSERKVREILFATYLTMIPIFIRWLIEGESDKVFSLVKSLKQQDHSLKEYIVQVIYEFDAGFRFLTEADGNPDTYTISVLESTDRIHAENVLSALVSGLDETYKDEYSSIKLALMRAMGAGRGKLSAVSY